MLHFRPSVYFSSSHLKDQRLSGEREERIGRLPSPNVFVFFFLLSFPVGFFARRRIRRHFFFLHLGGNFLLGCDQRFDIGLLLFFHHHGRLGIRFALCCLIFHFLRLRRGRLPFERRTLDVLRLTKGRLSSSESILVFLRFPSDESRWTGEAVA